jgi:DNA polymerase-3 subunit delta'
MRVEAANKLLKLIEEPPANTILLLIAEDTDSILKTILSRTQQIRVPPIVPEAIAAALTEQRIPPERALQIAHLVDGNYAEALDMAAPHNSSEEFWEKFKHLMIICGGNVPEQDMNTHAIALILWADDACKRFGREQQKQFLAFALRMVRESFMCGQNIGEATMADRISKFAARVHFGNVAALYEEFNLAYNHIAANGNARIVFTDLALKAMKCIYAK